MITNERQYRITRARAEEFRRALADLEPSTHGHATAHLRLLQAQREAMVSQLQDLDAELTEYEYLKAGQLSAISTDSFAEFADGLIKARIATGLTQKALADRLGLKEQQVQRYEAERYASASLQRLQEVAEAIGVRIHKEILLPVESTNVEGLVTKLRQVGLERDFLLTRLVPTEDVARLSGEVPMEDEASLTRKIGTTLGRVFGWSDENLFGAEALSVPRFAAAEARFKVPGGRSRHATSLYAAYANYLAVTVLNGSSALPKLTIPTDPQLLREAIVASHGSISLTSTLHFVWDRGVPILPLRDPGTFHGACWRYEGNNVIVLKQVSKHASRWLFDLLHELHHAGHHPEAKTFEVIEADENSSERRSSPEEIAASQFAGDVILAGRAEDLAQMCVAEARGSVEKLKRALPLVAARERVDVGSLANYMALRLSWQGINWWGAATNLQTEDVDPWLTSRTVFYERFPFVFQSEVDRQLLERALQ